MGNYEARLDRLEAAIAPRDELHLVPVRNGQTNDEALAVYASARGCVVVEVCGTVVYFTSADAALL